MVNTLSPGSDLTLRIPSVTEVYLQYIFLILPLATGFELLRAVPDLICHLFLLLVILYVYNQLKYIIIIMFNGEFQLHTIYTTTTYLLSDLQG